MSLLAMRMDVAMHLLEARNEIIEEAMAAKPKSSSTGRGTVNSIHIGSMEELTGFLKSSQGGILNPNFKVGR